jgi:Mg-chelatase subunit ChlD
MNEDSEPLRRLLQSLTRTYNTRKAIPVELSSDRSFIQPVDPGIIERPENNHLVDDAEITVGVNIKEVFGRNLSDANELRILTDTLSHEVEHYRQSGLSDKARFARLYPGNTGLAAVVYNVVEDAYIDFTRGKRYAGLRRSQAFAAKTIMSNGHRRPPLTSKATDVEQIVEGFLQISFAGYAKDVTDESVSDDVRIALAELRRLLKEVRHEDDATARYGYAHDAMKIILDSADVPSDSELLDEIDTTPADEGDPKDGDPVPVSYENPDARVDEDGNATADFEEYDRSDDGGDANSVDEADEQPDAENAVSDDTSDDAGDEGDTTADGDGENSIGENAENEDASGDDADDDGNSDPGGASPEGFRDESDANQSGDYTDEQADELGAMERADEDGDCGDWYDATDGYETPSEETRERAQRLREQERREQSDMAQRIKQRDERTENNEGVPHEDVESYLSERDLDDELAEAFRQLTSMPRDSPDRRGNRMNMAGVNRHMSGDYAHKDVYLNREIRTFGNLCIGVCVDMSSSMTEVKAKAALLALSIATDVTGDELVASAYSTGYSGNYSRLITAPNEAFKPEMLDSIVSTGGTPTGHGIIETLSLMERSDKREKLLIVITDGATRKWLPTAEYPGDTKFEQVNNVVQGARADGTRVIGMGVGSISSAKMKQQFETGRDAPALNGDGGEVAPDGYVNAGMSDMTELLVRMYREQIDRNTDRVY